MSTANKLTYLNDTKTRLKNIINLTGAEITNQTTFRNYATKLYDGYVEVLKDKYVLLDNMPKQTILGTDLLITNAANLPIYNFEITKQSTQATSILPSGYTQVDYIESSGTQYIDTGVKLQPDLFFDITLQHDNLGGMYGRYTNNNRVISQVYTDISNKLSFQYGNSSTSMNYILQNNLYDKYNIKVKDYKMYLNEVQVAENSNAILANSEDDFYLFRQSAIYGKGKIFYAKLYIGNTLVRDFIPCYRNADNEVGLYDLVNDVFYTNQGTGDFTYGNVVTIPNTDYPQEVVTIKNNIDVVVSNGINSQTYTIPLGSNEIVGKSINLDKLLIDKQGHIYLNKVFDKIDSYNGETITTDYLSTTRGLDTGATIYYVKSTPQLIDLNTTLNITLFNGTNNISNSKDGYMSIEYVKNNGL